MRVALFGGSFDPPHIGHQMAIVSVLATARVERLLMVPCFRHPFDKPLAPYEHRFAMCQLAAAPFGGHVDVSDIERRLGGESRTLRTVRTLRDENPLDTLVLVIGADLLEERSRWFGYDELVQLVEFAVVGRKGRAGTPIDEARAIVEIPDVSSTEIRARVQSGRAIEGLVASDVADYIAAHELYRVAPVAGV